MDQITSLLPRFNDYLGPNKKGQIALLTMHGNRSFHFRQGGDICQNSNIKKSLSQTDTSNMLGSTFLEDLKECLDEICINLKYEEFPAIEHSLAQLQGVVWMDDHKFPNPLFIIEMAKDADVLIDIEEIPIEVREFLKENGVKATDSSIDWASHMKDDGKLDFVDRYRSFSDVIWELHPNIAFFSDEDGHEIILVCRLKVSNNIGQCPVSLAQTSKYLEHLRQKHFL